MFLRGYELQFKLFSKLKHLQGPPYANQLVQNGTQVHATCPYFSTSHSGRAFINSLVFYRENIARQSQRIGASFHSAFFLVIFKTGIEHASKSLQ